MAMNITVRTLLASSPYPTLAIEFTAVPVDGGNTDQRCYLFSIERAKFWKLTEQGVGEYLTNARNTRLGTSLP